jgi:hypothetical protein
VHNGFASESNHLMAGLLDDSYVLFLTVKLSIGALASIVLWHWGKLPLARYGLIVALTIYISLMGVHFITGLSAFGFIPDSFINEVCIWSNSFFAFFN